MLDTLQEYGYRTHYPNKIIRLPLCYTRKELKYCTDKINTILDRKVDCLYSGKNPFTDLKQLRSFKSKYTRYLNSYIEFTRVFVLN